jgi:hypothetical protein
MNTKAKRVGPLQRTKSERVVTANHGTAKGQPRKDMTETPSLEPISEEARYRPTAREQIVLDRHAARQDAIAPVPRLRVRKDGQSPPILIEHPDPLTGLALLKEALGTVDDYFADGLLDQVINVNSPYGAPIESKLNFMLAVIAGIKQDDQPLAMLASQMALVQMAIMELGSRLANAVAPSAKESILREISRAARTFAMQLDALKRYRSSGEPKVTVQQVFMSEGRQASLDDVTKAPCEGTPEQPTTLAPALADTRQPAMEIVGKSEAAPVRRRQNNGGPSST